MKFTIFALLALAFTATSAAAAPVLSFQGAEAVVTLPAGHRVLWMSDESKTIAADTDGDGEIRFTPPSSYVAVMDLETAEYAVSSGVSVYVAIEGVVAPITEAKGPNGEMSLWNGEGTILWLRPGVGVWKNPANPTQLVPDSNLPFTDMAEFDPVSTSPGTPPHLQLDDWLVSFSNRSLSLNKVDLELADRAGYFQVGKRVSEHAEGTVATVTITRSFGTAGTVTTSCKVASTGAGTTAVAGIDYTPAEEQQLTFEPGEFFKQCKFTLIADGLYNDGKRELYVGPSPPSAGNYNRNESHQLKIVDSDPVPVLSFGAVPASVAEGDTNWMLDVPVSITGNFRGSIVIGTQAGEWDGTERPSITFTPSETSKTIQVPVDADDSSNQDVPYTIRLSPKTSGSRIQPILRTLTVIDDDHPALTMTDASVIESTDTVVLKVSTEEYPGSPATITWTTADGTATAAGDYVANSGTTKVGESITIRIRYDTLEEGPETFYIDITGFTGPIQPPARTRYAVTIVDDDAAPPTVTLTPMTVPEPYLMGGTEITMPVQLDAAMPTVVRVYIGPGGGNATQDADYRYFSRALTFLPGETIKDASIMILGDLRDEPDETLVVTATDNASRILGTTTITILDDDDTVVLSADDVQVMEKTGTNATATFTLTLSAASKAVLTVQYETLDVSAKSGADYTKKSGTLQFLPGETTKQVSVDVIGDSAGEADERFALRLFNLASYQNWVSVALDRDRAYATIADDDATVAIPAVSIDDIVVTETDGTSEAQFLVKLTRMAEQTASLAYETFPLSATSPADYKHVTGVLTFNTGDRSAIITVPITGDNEHEESEAFLLRIHSGQQLSITDVETVCRIQDDDPERTKRRTTRH